MLDHVSIGVTNLDRSRRFYDAALAPLGLRRVLDFEGRGSDYGTVPTPIVEFTITREFDPKPSIGTHVCFRAATRAVVMAFHQAALSAGGSDDGAPGVRAHYHPEYFGAFVRDPDGHRIEAVCHAPEVPANRP